jgi:anaerobic magnesium-protoporphyrin IX monomethyl ester cyclase
MRSTAFPLDHTTSRVQAVTLLRLCRILNFMKHLADQGVALPNPRPVPDKAPLPDPASDRQSISVQLLQWFLFDGRIRGVDKDGQVYVHKTDPVLCRAFARAMRKTPPCGTRKQPGREIPRL